MIQRLDEMLSDARNRKYAVPAFDVSNYEMIKAVIEVCEEERSPALFMCLKADMEKKGINFITAMLKEAEESYSVPICIHLDHATDMEDIKVAIDYGFSSVMYDGSTLPLSENIIRTKEVVRYAHDKGVSVEAELGHVGNGLSGDKDGVGEDVQDDPQSVLTVPEDVEFFIDRTEVDALAVSVGTSHGVYRKTPQLAFDRLRQINDISKKPLVLHGGSGTPEGQLQKAIELGICKINIYSEVLYAMNTGLKDKLNEINNLSMWPVYVFEEANKRMRDVIRRKIRAYGSNGRV